MSNLSWTKRGRPFSVRKIAVQWSTPGAPGQRSRLSALALEPPGTARALPVHAALSPLDFVVPLVAQLLRLPRGLLRLPLCDPQLENAPAALNIVLKGGKEVVNT